MRFRLFALAMTLFLFTSCSENFKLAAVTASPSGTFQVLYRPCESRLRPIETVRLLVKEGQIIGDSDDEVLWEVVARGDVAVAPLMVFEPGTVPLGYVEAANLRAPNRGDEVFVYVAVRDGGDVGLPFQWGQLDDGTLVTADGSKTEEQWMTYVAEACGELG